MVASSFGGARYPSEESKEYIRVFEGSSERQTTQPCQVDVVLKSMDMRKPWCMNL
jgi:hypothetical protein